jgi:hypothetical protein
MKFSLIVFLLVFVLEAKSNACLEPINKELKKLDLGSFFQPKGEKREQDLDLDKNSSESRVCFDRITRLEEKLGKLDTLIDENPKYDTQDARQSLQDYIRRLEQYLRFERESCARLRKEIAPFKVFMTYNRTVFTKVVTFKDAKKNSVRVYFNNESIIGFEVIEKSDYFRSNSVHFNSTCQVSKMILVRGGENFSSLDAEVSPEYCHDLAEAEKLARLVGDRKSDDDFHCKSAGGKLMNDLCYCSSLKESSIIIPQTESCPGFEHLKREKSDLEKFEDYAAGKETILIPANKPTHDKVDQLCKEFKVYLSPGPVAHTPKNISSLKSEVHKE